MTPFDLSILPKAAFDRYPSPVELLQYSRQLSKLELTGYLRHQVTEGIPFVFLNNPLLYEVVREWLSKKLEVHARDVTLIGSGRMGFSMAPAPDFGAPYTTASDLDLTIVSAKLFAELKQTFDQWKNDYDVGTVKPKSIREEGFWNDNLQRLPSNFSNHFVDTYKIPNVYSKTISINSVLWELSRKLEATSSFFIAPKISARVYKNWEAFSRQFMVNFNRAISNVDEKYEMLLSARTKVRALI